MFSVSSTISFTHQIPNQSNAKQLPERILDSLIACSRNISLLNSLSLLSYPFYIVINIHLEGELSNEVLATGKHPWLPKPVLH